MRADIRHQRSDTGSRPKRNHSPSYDQWSERRSIATLMKESRLPPSFGSTLFATKFWQGENSPRHRSEPPHPVLEGVRDMKCPDKTGRTFELRRSGTGNITRSFRIILRSRSERYRLSSKTSPYTTVSPWRSSCTNWISLRGAGITFSPVQSRPLRPYSGRTP